MNGDLRVKAFTSTCCLDLFSGLEGVSQPKYPDRFVEKRQLLYQLIAVDLHREIFTDSRALGPIPSIGAKICTVLKPTDRKRTDCKGRIQK